MKLRHAQELLDQAIRYAEEIGRAVSVTVVDNGGHVVAKARMDGADLLGVRMSEDKAYTAVAVNMPTADLQPLVQPGAELFGLQTADGGRLITFGGGVPIRERDGTLIGAIGVAGGSVAEDIAVAESGLRPG